MSEVRLESASGVATITLAAPERRNALTPEMANELVEACETIDADDSIGAVVIQAEGLGFCAGADRELLRAAGRDGTDDATFKSLRSAYEAFARVGRLAPPSIAAVRGAAVGAGVNLVFATDLRVIGHGARLIAGFLRIGVHPGGGHFTLVGRTAGREAVAAMTLFGEVIDGRKAVEIGAAWEALPDDEVEPRAQELARRVAGDPELARLAVRSMRQELGPPAVPWPVALDAETAVQQWSLRRALESGRLGE
jgi:enoyl-CoA hydratase